jgi:ABC-2 type transport system permease protein
MKYLVERCKKTWSVFWKTCLEFRRDLMIVSLTLVFAPFFVFIYWLFLAGGSTSYTVLVLNSDSGATMSDGSTLARGEEVAQAISHVDYPNGNPLLRVKRVTSRLEAEQLLRDREALVLVVIPKDFSSTLQTVSLGNHQVSTSLEFGGDLTNPYYIIAAILTTSTVDSYVRQVTGVKPVVEYVEQPLGSSAARTEFEIYVPGILVFSVILMIFLAAMTVTREVETGTLKRLRLTSMTSFDLLAGVSVALVLVGAISVGLTFFTATALGFRSQGPMWVAVVIGAVTSLSIIGAGMVVASFARSVSQAFVIANFPLGFFMAFSGVMFPIPRITLFTVGGHAIGPYDILPSTHAVRALNKVLTLGGGFHEVTYELSMLAILSLAYFLAGVWLFKRTHLR